MRSTLIQLPKVEPAKLPVDGIRLSKLWSRMVEIAGLGLEHFATTLRFFPPA
jgi:hypothetical protein